MENVNVNSTEAAPVAYDLTSADSSDAAIAMIGCSEWRGDIPRCRTLLGKGCGGRFKEGREHVLFASQVPVPTSETHYEQVNLALTDADRDGVCGLTEKQWYAIKSIINAGKENSTEKITGTSIFSSWILDTGASHHLTGRYEALTNIREMAPVLIIMADGREKVALKEGSVRLGSSLLLKSVYFVEDLKSDLISVAQMMDENECVVQFADRFVVVQDRNTRTVIGAGDRVGGTYHFRSTEYVAAVTTKEEKDLELWHNRLGHPSVKVVGLLPNVSSAASSAFLNKACDICLRAKQTRDSFPLSTNKTTSIFELIHVDLWGPYRVPAHSGARYFLTIVDDFSRGVWLYLLSEKSEAQQYLKNFFVMTERQFNARIKTIRSDNGSEFLSMTSFFQQNGVIHEMSCVGTPQQNGRVERKHRHILNVARALMFKANLPIRFWGECVLTAGYLINRTPSSVLGNLTPYERLFGKKPTYDHLRVLGSLCYAHSQLRGGDKFASRSRKCVFMGYPYGKKGWRLFDLESQEFFVSRDVVFSENEFPFALTNSKVSNEESQILWQPMCDNLIDDDAAHVIRSCPAQNTTQEISSSSRTTPVAEPVSNEPAVIDHVTSENLPPVLSNNSEPNLPAAEPLGRGYRTKHKSVTLKNYVVNSIESRPSEPSSSRSLYPLADHDDLHRFSKAHVAYIVAINSIVEPKSFKQAMKNSKWRDAISSEYSALEENGTWTIVDLPVGKQAIGSQWVFKVKFLSDGEIERYKARLVAMGNNQIEGEDYGETFSPVAKMGTVRLFLAAAVKLGWEVHQMDVHNAFLHGDLDEEVYMRLPPGYQLPDKNKVCRLRKSLYGLKQAPRCWFAKLSAALIAYGFVQSLGDYSLFTYEKDNKRIHILIYVDDLIITGSCVAATQAFKDYLSDCFHMKDLGHLKFFLGLEVARNSKGMYLCQRKYALDIIAEAGLLGARPASFPLEQNNRLALSDSPLLQDPKPYRRLLGRLIYLAVTRPDLAYAVHVLAQFMQQPRTDHWTAALRVIRYLKSDPGQGILLRADADFQLTGWCDSDWASCPLSRRSVTGYFVQLGDSPVSWKTKKQHTVSRSSAEAEYRALAFLVQELIWLKSMLNILGIRHEIPMVVNCDSKSAIYIATNPVFHERTKHIELDCHFVRDEVLKDNIRLQHVITTSQLADIFTKPIGKDGFKNFLCKLGIQNLYAPA